VIGQLLQSQVSLDFILGVLIVKSIIWSVSLGSGTSGGVLAPLLMMGGALGALEAHVLPDAGVGFWPLVSMGAILGGTMRSPFTGVIFALELTHDINALLPLLIATFVAHGFTVLVMRRSILTEKVARRGFHLSREYAVDPLEIIFVRDAMRTSITTIPGDAAMQDVRQSLVEHATRDRQGLYPVVTADQRLVGVVTRQKILDAPLEDDVAESRVADHFHSTIVVAYPDEPLRVVVYRMAESGLTRLPVVERENGEILVGLISLGDLLKARVRTFDEERRRERVLRVRSLFPVRPR
jgi:CIC family chloride channel protein